MVRSAKLTVLALLVALVALGAGLAAPAGAAFPPVPTLIPDWDQYYKRAREGGATGLAAANSAVVFSCGHETTAAGDTNISVRRAKTDIWARTWDGPAHRDDRALDVALWSQGKAVYVAGTAGTTSGGNKAVLLKYSFTGRRLWVRQYTGLPGSDPVALFVRVDGVGRPVVVGRLVIGRLEHLFAAKYRADGKLMWSRVYKAGYRAIARDACLDGAGNLYIAGQSQETTASSRDGMVIKYAPDGTRRWVKQYDSPYGLTDDFSAVCRRPAGGVYVAGTSSCAAGDNDGVVMRCSVAGTLTAVKRLGFLDTRDTELADVAAAADGDVAVTGAWETTSGGDDFYVACIDESGAIEWSHLWDSEDGPDRGELIAVSGAGNVAVSGTWAAGIIYQKTITFFITSTGTIERFAFFSGDVTGADPSRQNYTRDLVVKGDAVWIAGQMPWPETGQDAFVFRFLPWGL